MKYLTLFLAFCLVAEAFVLLVQAVPTTYTVFKSANTRLEYPTVADGYLWTVSSRPTYAINKYDLSTGTFLATKTLPYSYYLDELFECYITNGHIFVPGITYTSNGIVLRVLNEQTLATELIITNTQFQGCGTTQVYYDDTLGKMVIALTSPSTGGSTVGFYLVDPNQCTTFSAYQYVSVEPFVPAVGGAGWECAVTSFNGKFYFLYMNNGAAGKPITTTTKLLSSTSISGPWTTEFTTQEYADGNGAYFPHISANDKYIVCGVLSNANDGITSFRYLYKSTTSEWQEYNTNIPRNNGESHPMVQAINNDDSFILDPNARFNTMQQKFYLFHASTGTVENMFTLTDYGFNDRWMAIDTVHNYIYFASCELPNLTCKIYKITFDTQLYDPLQANNLVPSPTPTPDPTASPNPTPIPTKKPRPTPKPRLR
jgi:hypothetical protein